MAAAVCNIRFFGGERAARCVLSVCVGDGGGAAGCGTQGVVAANQNILEPTILQGDCVDGRQCTHAHTSWTSTCWACHLLCICSALAGASAYYVRCLSFMPHATTACVHDMAFVLPLPCLVPALH